jgi:isocitrate dehydrogenase
MKHRIKELLTSLPVDTAEAKRLFMAETGISRDKFYRMYSNPDFKFSLEDALRIARFFSIETQEMYCKEENVMGIVTKIMNESKAIKNLRNDELETRLQSQKQPMAERTSRGNRKSCV